MTSTTSDSAARPRVLHIAGGTYAHGFLIALAEALATTGQFTQSLVRHRNLRGGPPLQVPEGVFESVHEFPLPASIGPVAVLRGLVTACPPEVLDDGSFKSALGTRARWAYLAPKLAKLSVGYDIFHWHSFDPDLAPYVHALPRTGKLLITLWGSDVLRTSGAAAEKRHQFASARADGVSAASAELRDAFLIRCGQELAPKFHLVNYGSKLLPEIDRQKNSASLLRQSLEIPEDRVVVVIGHSGARENQHLEVLDSLRTLPPNVLQRLAVVVPFAYAGRPGYRSEVETALGHLGTVWRLLDQFLTPADVARLRCMTDVLIHVPVSDQLSAAMCESIYGGAVLITGDWLPYSPLRNRGIPFFAVGSAQEVAGAVDRVLKNFTAARGESMTAQARMSELMGWDQLKWRWAELYQKQLGLLRTA